MKKFKINHEKVSKVMIFIAATILVYAAIYAVLRNAEKIEHKKIVNELPLMF